jgi:DNA-binding transcriptional LysR family regulator
LTLSLNDRIVDMLKGGVDLSIRIRPALPSGHSSTQVKTELQACRFFRVTASPILLVTIPARKEDTMTRSPGPSDDIRRVPEARSIANPAVLADLAGARGLKLHTRCLCSSGKPKKGRLS